MAKTYLDIVKYMVEASFSIGGKVDNPDIIGAVFGQTEGLLGDELDLRELQKNGKIGRIEIEVSQNNSRTLGKLFLPASLDRIETCILAAAIESVDRVGPYDASFKVAKVEDTRTSKRKRILERAKELIQKLTSDLPDSKELAEIIQSEVKSSEITTYGVEPLPAGPDVAKSKDVIIVEGRADVLNLLRYDITNAIAVGGAATKIPKTIVDLCNDREVTIFVDGDRGGDLIARSICAAGDADYIAKAPDGKEVEELTRKEVIKAMRTRVPVEQAQHHSNSKHENHERYERHEHRDHEREYGDRRERRHSSQQRRDFNSHSSHNPYRHEDESHSNPAQNQEPTGSGFPQFKINSSNAESAPSEQNSDVEQIASGREEKQVVKQQQKAPVLEAILLSQMSSALTQLSNTFRSRLYDRSGNMIKEVPIRELLSTIQSSSEAYGIVLDGIITQRLVELAQMHGINAIYGIRANPITNKGPSMIIYTKEQGRL